jgi:S-DNA-T family DNA segregation ATPase FtsK/SpoIIIE
MSSSNYELQAARIEQVFSAHKVPARVWQATVTPRFVRFDVTTALGIKLDRAENLGDELAYALGVRSARVYREGGVLHVDVPRATPRTVELGALLAKIAERKQFFPACTAVLGVGEDGAPLLLQLSSPDVAHVLIAGTTGSGKSELLRTLLISLALRNRAGRLQLILIDPKNFPLRVFAELPHCQALAVEVGQAVTALQQAVLWMERRARGSLPHVVIAIDELADLLLTGGRPVEEALVRLTQRGREVNIHVIAATQRPAAALVGGLVKANFPVRLVGSVTSAADALVAAGVGGTGAERLLGRGDFLLSAKGQVIRFQAAYATSAALEALVAGIGRVVRPVGLGGVGPEPAVVGPVELFGVVAAPTQPNPARRALRERYSGAELVAFVAATGGNLSEAAKAAFGYKDPATLALVREAASGMGGSEEAGTDA